MLITPCTWQSGVSKSVNRTINGQGGSLGEPGESTWVEAVLALAEADPLWQPGVLHPEPTRVSPCLQPGCPGPRSACLSYAAASVPLPAKQQEPTFPLPSRWLTQKGARQKKINEWLGIKNETEE